MSKRHRNAPHPGYFKVAGGAVEEPDVAQQAKQALAREKARVRSRAGLKTRLGEAPPEQHAHEHELTGPPHVEAMKEQLTGGPPAAEPPGEVVYPRKRRGLVRAVAGRAFGAARLMLGLAGRVVRLPFRAVKLPFRVVHWLRHHDQQPA
jgi:hypothetical protein